MSCCSTKMGCGTESSGSEKYPDLVETSEVSTEPSSEMGKLEEVSVAAEGGDAPSACTCNPCTCNPCGCK